MYNKKSKMTISNEKKWMISFISAIVFFIIASPEVYKFTNSILEPYFCIKTIDDTDTPTRAGVLIHAVVFMSVTRLLMNYNFEDSLLQMFKNDQTGRKDLKSFQKV